MDTAAITEYNQHPTPLSSSSQPINHVHILQPPITSFSSPAGQALARELLRPILGYDPHDYNIEGTCKSLDGFHLISLIPTGGGKSGFFFIPVLLRKLVQNDPRFASELRLRHKGRGTMILVLPTLAVEAQMAC
jgi:superfamily II DNA helicase RecQ